MVSSHMERVLLCFLFSLALSQRPTVTLNNGVLIGISMQTWMGRNFSAFLRVPYAAPPVGQLRFAVPQPVQPWSTPLDSGSTPPMCPQLNPGNSSFSSFNEDCLYLSIYTPQIPNSSNAVSLPVIVYIPGGAFTNLAGSIFGPRYLLDYNLVLVTLNYRLGALGFLTTLDSVLPGNMGLKDQACALKWVKNNIAAFGGNPNQVTIAGTSAGSASVIFHLMSPLSRGLFVRAICHSGSAFMPSAFQKAPLLKAKTLASGLNCPTNSSMSMLNCLRNSSVEDILLQQSVFFKFYTNPPEPYGPIVEMPSPTAFLTQYPYQLLRTGLIANVPVLMSLTTHEGIVPVAGFVNNMTGISALNDNFLEYAPVLLDYEFTVAHRNLNATSNKIRQFYFGNQPITAALNQTLIRMAGERLLVNDIETTARLLGYTSSAPVYVYQFGYRGQYSAVTHLLSGTNENLGVGHADDIVYIFNVTFSPLSENTPTDREMITVMSSLWANFSINGYPTIGNVSWSPVNGTNAMNGPLNYVYIASPTSFIPNSTLGFGNSQFWNNLLINEPMSGRPAGEFV